MQHIIANTVELLPKQIMNQIYANEVKKIHDEVLYKDYLTKKNNNNQANYDEVKTRLC